MNIIPFMIGAGIYLAIFLAVYLLGKKVLDKFDIDDEEWEDWI